MNPYKDLPKEIYIVFVARVVNSIGNFVMPFLALLLTDNLGLSVDQAGVFVMIAAGLYATGSLIGGRLCDIVGRKKVLIIFQSLAALSLIPCAFLGHSYFAPWFLIFSGFFGGAANPSHTSIVSDITNSGNRKSAFSLLFLGNNIGLAVGPMIAGLLYKNHRPWIFIGDAATTLVSIILVGCFIKETKPVAYKTGDNIHMAGSNEKSEEGGLLEALLKRPMLLTFSGIMIIYSFVNVQYTFSLPLELKATFGDNGPSLYGILMTFNAVTVVVLTPFITGFTMKIRPTVAMILGGVQYAMGFGMIYFIRSFPMFIISTIIWTAGEVLVTTNSGVYTANNTPMSHRGRFNAVLPLMTGIGYAFGPLVTGIFIDSYGIRPAWILTFAAAMCASAMMLGLQTAESSHTRRIGEPEIHK
jgi:Arabinose efflux permease